MNSIEFLQNWFQSNCDGNWEHNFGIKIETLDNPGWYIVVDLENTSMENTYINQSVDSSERDWFDIKTLNKQLIATGDSHKLFFLLNKIQEILSNAK